MKPVINHIDGFLYVGMAICTTVTALMETADAIANISPKHLFVIRSVFEVVGAACLAAKTYRSTTFANKQQQDRDANVISSTTNKTLVAEPGQPAKSETATETVVAPAAPADKP